MAYKFKVVLKSNILSLALLEKATALGADTVLVHHGYFWRNEDAKIIGQKYLRLKKLIVHDINLLAYHLPLDAHLTLGNNAQLGKLLGFTIAQWFGKHQLACIGNCAVQTLENLSQHIAQQLGRTPLVVGNPNQVIRRIAWCSGAAQDWLAEAMKFEIDAYISGEISESTVHLAEEMGVAYIAAGHHATERGGIHALGEHLRQQFQIQHTFIDIPNPV
jgi:dinuclear metal center YbgI/SA1388 family protein